MKKQLILTAIAASMATGLFAQGYADFGTTGKNWTYDNFTTPGTSLVSGGSIDVAFLIGAAGQTPLVNSIGASNPTGNTTSLSPVVWSDIMTDPNFSFAYNLSGNTLCSVTVNSANLAKGGFAYLNNTSFQVNGVAAGAYNVYVIGWDAKYATPTLAAAANAAVGWSSMFTYTLTANLSTAPQTFNASGMTAFGVSPVTVPEPCTMALLGLGGLSLLVIRRRK